MNRRRFIQSTLAAVAAVSMRAVCQDPPGIVDEPGRDDFIGQHSFAGGQLESLSDMILAEHAAAWAEHIDRTIMDMPIA